ncbi:MAG: hypothetical protein ACRDGL_00190, partial [Candidatus Limnocylindrales bacterium]
MSAPAPRPPIASPRGLTTTRELRPSDVAGVVELHLALFPEYFLTHLGRAFLGRFYAGFARGGADFGFVAEANGQPVGFVVGTLDPADVYRRFYRRNLLHLGPIVLDRIVRDAYVRRHLGPRLRHLALAAVSLLQPGTRPARAPRPEHAARRPEHAARRPEHA